MKTITTNNRTLLFVEVPSPSDGGGFRIESNTFRYEQYGWKGWSTKSIELPCGTYRLIATTDTITEEQAVGIVERSKFNNQLYHNYQFKGVEPLAIDSFTSFLRKHSITGRNAIIEVL